MANALALGTEQYLADEPEMAHPVPFTGSRSSSARTAARSPPQPPFLQLDCSDSLTLADLTGARNDHQVAMGEENHANQSAEEMARELYLSDANSAYHAPEEGITDKVHELLSRHVPQPNAENRRGFEWHCFWGQYQRTQRSPTFRQDSPYLLAFSFDDTVLASGSRLQTVELRDMHKKSEFRTLVHGPDVTGIGFSPSGNTLMSGESGSESPCTCLHRQAGPGTTGVGCRNERLCALFPRERCHNRDRANRSSVIGNIAVTEAAETRHRSRLAGRAAKSLAGLSKGHQRLIIIGSSYGSLNKCAVPTPEAEQPHLGMEEGA